MRRTRRIRSVSTPGPMCATTSLFFPIWYLPGKSRALRQRSPVTCICTTLLKTPLSRRSRTLAPRRAGQVQIQLHQFHPVEDDGGKAMRQPMDRLLHDMFFQQSLELGIRPTIRCISSTRCRSSRPKTTILSVGNCFAAMCMMRQPLSRGGRFGQCRAFSPTPTTWRKCCNSI